MKDKNLEKQIGYFLVNKIKELKKHIKNLKKQHKQALSEAYEKGYNKRIVDDSPF